MSVVNYKCHILVVSLTVYAFLILEYSCDFIRGPELQVSQSSRYNNLHKNISEWPTVGQRRQHVTIGNHELVYQNNQNNLVSFATQNNHSVAESVKQWNSYANAAASGKSNSESNVRGAGIHTNSRANEDFHKIRFDEDEVENIPNLRKDSTQVTDEELRTFSEKLFEKTNQSPANYITVNFQGRTTSRSKNDEAPLPLMRVRKEVYDIPTISKLQPLYDNYEVRADVNEDYTQQKKQEETEFLKSILDTDVMEETRQFLIKKGAINQNRRKFENILRDIWFNHYSRGKRRIGSSGFEHVFLGEIKKNDVSGLHNWLYFEREESNNRANYLGYLKTLDLGNNRYLLKLNFDFQGINKPVGSMFIGTCPEFEMALYSTCFLLRADKICPMKLNGKRFIIRTYTFKYDGKDLIGSAFAEI